jgi:hypothetical protein
MLALKRKPVTLYGTATAIYMGNDYYASSLYLQACKQIIWSIRLRSNHIYNNSLLGFFIKIIELVVEEFKC